jgi:SPP1 family predicted phage head-tail adaptor
MQAGDLDRRIQIQEQAVTQNATGEEVLSWITVATVWAQKIENFGQERFQSSQFIGKSACSFKFRWSNLTKSVTTKHRIVFDGNIYDIQDRRELGRREGVMVDCSARNETAITHG